MLSRILLVAFAILLFSVNGTLAQSPSDVDMATLRSYGYIGDGASHPLNSNPPFNGQSTAGWTLAQWQAVLPAAVAMTDEIDGVAIQSLIQTATGPIAFHIGPGQPQFSRTITVCNQTVVFFGSGGMFYKNPPVTGKPYVNSATNFNFLSRGVGIQHCSGAPGDSKIELHDIGLTLSPSQTSPTDASFTINDLKANYDFFDNVQISGFNNCIHFVNPAGTRLRSVWCQNPDQAKTNNGTGLLYEGANSFINHIQDAVMGGYQISYDFNSTPTTGQVGIEDLQVLNSACGGTATCIRIRSQNANYGPFNYSFTNMSVDATTYFINALSCNDVTVQGGNWLIDPPSTAWTSGFNMIDISACSMFHMRDMWIGNTTAASPNSILTAEATSKDVEFRDNYIETLNITPIASFIQVANGAKNVSEQNTTWMSFFSPIPPPSNAVGNFSADPSNKIQSQATGLPTLSSCGTGPTLKPGSTNAVGQIIEGTKLEDGTF